MDIWRSESSSGKQLVLTAAVLLVGLLLVIGFRHYSGPGMSNSMAGYLLGWLLLIIGVAGLLTWGKQTITVDPTIGRIEVEDTNFWGKKTREIAFDEIMETRVAEIGDRSDHAVTYYLLLKLKNGNSYPLFYPAYYDGKWERSVAEDRRQRLETYLQSAITKC